MHARVFRVSLMHARVILGYVLLHIFIVYSREPCSLEHNFIVK
jgi:hypothetical protein